MSLENNKDKIIDKNDISKKRNPSSIVALTFPSEINRNGSKFTKESSNIKILNRDDNKLKALLSKSKVKMESNPIVIKRKNISLYHVKFNLKNIGA
jgi:hypothetical protein